MPPVAAAAAVPAAAGDVGPTATDQQQQREQQHAWEQTDSSQMWSSVQEDADGNLLTTHHTTSAATLIRLRRRRLARSDSARSHRRLVRDMIRYVYLVVDCSQPMYQRDPALPGAATRFDVVLSTLSTFIRRYYDENPLSHLGLIAVRNGEAEMITRLTGSRSAHGAALVQLRRDVAQSVAHNPHSAGGVFSLQNGLEVAGRSLGHMPKYGSREVLVVMGALATCDPGDVLVETLPKLKAARVRVSTVALQAEVHVCRRLADETGGILGVCLDRGHLTDLILGQCTPPPARPGEEMEEEEGGKRPKRKRHTCDMVRMGFPSHRTDDVPSLVHAGSSRGGSSDAHRALLIRTGYVCPRCRAKTSELPADCAVCGLKLVLAPHLARTFHHLFPVPPFAEVAEEVDLVTETGVGVANTVAKKGRGDRAAPSSSSAAGGTPTCSIVGSAPPSCVASDADVTSSSGATFEIVGSHGGDGGGGSGREETTILRKEVQIDARLLVTSAECDRCCFGCLKVIGAHRPAITATTTAADGQGTNKKRKAAGAAAAAAAAPPSSSAAVEDPNAPRPEPLRFQCPDCRNLFCADCDAYLHETLHNCPGCLCAPPPPPSSLG